MNGFQDYVWVRIFLERAHNFHQILREACDSEKIGIMRTTLYKFRRKRKEEWTREKVVFLSLLFSVLLPSSLTMTHYVNVNWFGCLPQGLEKIKRTKEVKYTLKHWNCKAHLVESWKMNELYLSSRPGSDLRLMDKWKGRGRAELYVMAPAPGSSPRGCRGGGRQQAVEPTLSPLPDSCPLQHHSGPVGWGTSQTKLPLLSCS